MQSNGLAANAAQIGESGCDTTAVNHEVRVQAFWIDALAETHRPATTLESGQEGAVVQPALVGQVKPTLESSRQGRFQFGDPGTGNSSRTMASTPSAESKVWPDVETIIGSMT